MDDTVIKAENISKRYFLGTGDPYKTIRESIVNLFRKPLKTGSTTPADAESNELWALRDVSFEIKQGDIVGVIGRNGAGKSTLLKILARITEPTSGRITMKGRIGSLLEVGTGFHPELSGHENVYLYGAILGMSRLEVTRKFDEIIAFSELEKFVETPVKRYSSGMYMRLAFAVAAHLDPEILLVDEVLAVGDVSFQKKCLGKMDEVSKSGRTVLFVSHNMSSIQRLCTKGILLDKGRITATGPTAMVTELYVKSWAAAALFWQRGTESAKEVFFSKIFLRGPDGNPADYITTTDSPCLVMEFSIKKRCCDLQLSVDLLDKSGDAIFVSAPQDASLAVPELPGDYTAQIHLPKELLLPTSYGIRAVLWHSRKGIFDAVNDIQFTAQETDSFSTRTPMGRLGKIALKCEWSIEKHT